MNTKLSIAALALVLAAPLSAQDYGFGNYGFTMPQDHTYVAKPPMPALPQPVYNGSRATAEWTIMVYVNGKNDLEQFALRDINEMEMVGSSDKVNIVVEMGRIDGYDTSDGDWKGVRRYLIKKDNNTQKIGSTMLQDMGMSDMGDYRNLAAFGKWAKQAYPAKRYMLVTWNHGNGWLKNGERRITKGISFDEQSGNHINTPQLGLALKEIGKVQVYGSDACLMQMPEVAYEIKDYTDYIVSSEETEPGDGYTYNTFLAPVVAKPTMGASEVARQAVNAYSDHYDKQPQTGYTQSYLAAAAIPEFLNKVNEFAYAITQANDKAAAKAARDAAVNFAVEDNRDLHHFATLVAQKSQNAEVKAKAQALTSFITTSLVKHHRSKNDPGSVWNDPKDYSPTRGIAIYLPAGALGRGYTDLQWAKYSNWDEFITWLNK